MEMTLLALTSPLLQISGTRSTFVLQYRWNVNSECSGVKLKSVLLRGGVCVVVVHVELRKETKSQKDDTLIDDPVEHG